MQRISVSLGEREHGVLSERAVREGRSVSQMARVLLEAALTDAAAPAPRGEAAVKGERGVAAPAAAAALPPPDTPQTVARKARQARSVMERAREALGAGAAVDVDPPAPAAKPSPGRSLQAVIGDPKLKPPTTSKAFVDRSDNWSIVCPKRSEHTEGVACPHCKGSHP